MDCIDALMPGCTFARGRGRGGIIELARAVGKCGRVVDYVEEVFYNCHGHTLLIVEENDRLSGLENGAGW